MDQVIAALADFHFVRPAWLSGLLPAIALPIWWARRQRSGSQWAQVIDPNLQSALLEPARQGRRPPLPAALTASALLIAVLGLAGPAWQRLPQPVEQKRDALVILFDLSLSMYARDLTPDRLTRARREITDLLRLRDEGLTALVAYAGDAHVVAPLTDDTRTIENLLSALAPGMMPVFGSKPGEALALARELFENARQTQGRLLLVTDGIETIGQVTEHCQRRFPLSILGVGSPTGARIPLDFADQPGRVLHTASGAPVEVRLDAERLATVAELCHGRYRTSELGDSDIAWLSSTRLPGESERKTLEREFDVWFDYGWWAAILLLPLALLGFRKGLLLPCLILLIAPPAQADWWDDLWRRPDQQGHRALTEDQPAEAAELFEDPAWRSAAVYRQGDYAAAAEGWRGGDLDANYNLGNALAHLGDYAGAIDAYTRVLDARPEHADAAANKALVAQLLEEQEAQQSAQSESGEQQASDESSEQAGSGSSAPDSTAAEQPEETAGNPDDQNTDASGQETAEQEATPEQASAQVEQAAEAPPPEPSQSPEADAEAERQAQATEQWLRRVPDDPGGLLRRKFQYETNQRRRQGEYQNRQDEQIW